LKKANKPIQHETKESFCNYNKLKSENVSFVYCDDTTEEARIFAASYISNNKVFLKYSSGNYWELAESGIASIAFNAMEKSQKEYLLNDYCISDSDGHSWKAYAVIDSEKSKFYAFKIELKTNTSSVTEYIHLPKLIKPKKRIKTFYNSYSI